VKTTVINITIINKLKYIKNYTYFDVILIIIYSKKLWNLLHLYRQSIIVLLKVTPLKI